MPGPAAAGGMRGPAVGPSGAFCVCRTACRPRLCRPARRPRRLPSGAASLRLPSSAVSSPPGAYAPGLVSASVRKAVQAASLLRSSASCMTA